MSIPPIVERFENNSPLQSLENRPQKRLKRAKTDNGISPRQMVTYLLKELIPEERLKTMKPSDDIPDKIRDAIKGIRLFQITLDNFIKTLKNKNFLCFSNQLI
jgi:hypothetical protein